MKRLHDLLQKDVQSAYAVYDFEFHPRWFAVVYTLAENGSQSVTELAAVTGMPHPNIIQLLKELEKEGWVSSETDPADKRVRLMSLSEEAQARLPKLKAIWSDMRRVVDQIIAEGQIDFWSGLLEFEASMAKRSFKQRLMDMKQQSDVQSQDVLHPGKWFDRPFHFDQLNTTPHGVIERLSLTAIRLRERVKNLSEDKLTHSKKGKWSVKQNIGHLTDLEPIWYGRVNDILEGKEQMRGIDLTNRKTHEADHNYLSTDDLISNFATERAKLVQWSRDHFEHLTTKSSIHPRLGVPMRMVDLLYFVAEHDDHHLTTIHYLISQ